MTDTRLPMILISKKFLFLKYLIGIDAIALDYLATVGTVRVLGSRPAATTANDQSSRSPDYRHMVLANPNDAKSNIYLSPLSCKPHRSIKG